MRSESVCSQEDTTGPSHPTRQRLLHHDLAAMSRHTEPASIKPRRSCIPPTNVDRWERVAFKVFEKGRTSEALPLYSVLPDCISCAILSVPNVLLWG